ncbi:MAG: LPS-assembly protein LptD [Desulfomonile tiedjei]|nr:LPS-assembly protein LptD [Desulfomonile tiedjei]
MKIQPPKSDSRVNVIPELPGLERCGRQTVAQGCNLLRRIAVLAAAFALLVSSIHMVASEAAAQKSTANDAPKEKTIVPTDVPIDISADRVSINYESNTYVARGNVTLSQGNTRLRADSIQYDGNTGELAAMGKVIVRMGSDVVEAEKITIKIGAATGVVVNGKLLLTRHNVYLEGKKLEKTGESTYRVEDGSFTTCDGTTPAWRITGRDLDVTLEGYGRLRHGFFYIKNIPVFYLPWLVYPAKRTRQSGFLMPTLANSTKRGIDVRLPFFIDFSPSVDATIVPRVCTKRAAQTSLEFRYFPFEDFTGRFYGEYTYDWQYGPEENPKSHRFYLTWRHDQDLVERVRLKGNANWVSDRNYFEFWGDRFDKRLRVRYLESNGVVDRQSTNFLFQAEARYFDNLDLPDNALSVQNIPIVTGTVFNQQIPYTPFYLSTNLIFNHYYAPIMHNQWLGSRLNADTRLSLPVALGRFLKLEPSMTYFAKAYSADYFQREKSISSVHTVRTDLYQVDADMFTDLQAVYDKGFFGFQRVRHMIRPRVTWTFRPFTKHQTYPFFDDSDRMDRASLLVAEMRQTLTGRLGPNEYLDFLTLNVSQGYDFQSVGGADASPDQRFLNLYGWTKTQAELTIKPHTLVDLTAQAEYDPVLNRARKYSLNVGLMDHRGDLLRVLHQFTEDEKREDLNRQTNVNLQVKLTSDLDCFFENQFTHQFNFAYFTSFGLNYHPQCWSVLLRYSEVREQDPVTQKIKDPDQTVFMTLSLYGLGQVYRFTRDWGEILGHAGDDRDTATR